MVVPVQVDPVAGELQLLYSDMTEEVIKGSDFTDLLCKGHLVLAPGVAPPHTSMTRQQGGQHMLVWHPYPPVANSLWSS